jgi:hypothetical protein
MLHWLTAVPTPVPEYTGDPDIVTPGAVGFIITFLVAALTVLLIIDMVRRVRRVRYREQVREELAAERAAGESPAQP